MTFGMGYRTRRTCEYLLILQKEPCAAKSTWLDHEIPDVWAERNVSSTHPHRKPTRLVGRLIQCVTKSNDIVLDVCSGSFLTFEMCKAYKRNFLGTDIVFGLTDGIKSYNDETIVEDGGALLLTLTED